MKDALMGILHLPVYTFLLRGVKYGRQSLPIRVGDGLNDHPLPTERLVPAGKPLLDQQLNKRSSRGFLMKSSKKISPCCFIRSIPAAPAFFLPPRHAQSSWAIDPFKYIFLFHF